MRFCVKNPNKFIKYEYLRRTGNVPDAFIADLKKGAPDFRAVPQISIGINICSYSFDIVFIVDSCVDCEIE